MTDSTPLPYLASELAAELLEPAFDRLLTSEALKELPLLGSAVRLAGVARSVRDHIFTAKVARFLTQLGELSGADVADMLFELKRDDELRDRVSGAVLLVLDKLDELSKADLVVRAFRAYLRKRLAFSECRRICQVINSAFLDDLAAFIALPAPKDVSASELRRTLQGVGLTESSQTGVQLQGFTHVSIDVSTLGELFYKTMREN